jgi:hypothetical protein
MEVYIIEKNMQSILLIEKPQTAQHNTGPKADINMRPGKKIARKKGEIYYLQKLNNNFW